MFIFVLKNFNCENEIELLGLLKIYYKLCDFFFGIFFIEI